MRVLVINTTERQGGPAIAAFRLTEALKANGIQAKMLVREKETDRVTTIQAERTLADRLSVIRERATIGIHNRLKAPHRYLLHSGSSGSDITRLPEFRQADVIHLHWVNDGMLSLAMLRRILDSGKPVVWTLHDMWPFTGICHYAHECDDYRTHCHNCFQLNSGSSRDLSYRVFERKRQLLQSSHISRIRFVTCSHWLETMARDSALLEGQPVSCIPNAVPTSIFFPHPRKTCRESLRLPQDRRLILFSSQFVGDRRKGYTYLTEALRRLVANDSQWRDNLGVVVIGRDADRVAAEPIAVPVYPMAYLSDERHIAEVINACDLLCIPSLQDNLPNTVVEAMACGLPCVGFEVGGIPEMIDHLHNGYIANYKDPDSLAEGIRWILTDGDYSILSSEALRKARTAYSETSVASQYINVYNALTGKHE